ncbi:MAG: MerR family transcriptional regulator [Oscillospiraceae bacterium]
MKLKIKDVAKRTGVTVRTLHYYDEIGLLPPSQVTQAGYRIYDDADLEVLQQILFFRELDFPLADIKSIMQNPQYDKAEALTRHRELLLQKRNHLEGLLALLEHTMKGEKDMSFKQFDKTQMEESKNKYAAEAKARWGHTDAYKESEEKTAGYEEKQWKQLDDEGTELLKCFGENRKLPPESQEAQTLVTRWQSYITANFYACTNEILAGLGQMYIGDVRFTENIDKNGTGTAAFMARAIEIYCSQCNGKG